jgi:hypothetical protein
MLSAAMYNNFVLGTNTAAMSEPRDRATAMYNGSVHVVGAIA